MLTVRDVKDKLEKLTALGSPEAIAMEFSAQGIKAVRMSAHRCAVARYLGNPPNATVSTGHVAVCQDFVLVQHRPSAPTTRIPTPPVVRQFINHFDAGAYPELDAEA